MNELNLLLRHQIIKRSDPEVCMNTPQEAYYEEEYTSSLVLPRKSTFEGSPLEDRCEELKVELASIQLEESTALEQHKTLTESYNLLETITEHVLNHMDCLVLEIKSANRLSSCLNTFSIHEQYINEPISASLKRLNETHDLSSFERFKGQLLMILADNNGDIKKLHNEFQERQSNYKLALKNFKIILEILNVNEDSLRKLKQQFDEVLMDYQHCRCILDQELPFAIADRTRVLADCLIFLKNEYDALGERRGVMGSLLGDIGRKVRENEYILVKKEIASPRTAHRE